VSPSRKGSGGGDEEEPRPDETQEYELGEEFLDDVDHEEEVREEELADEELRKEELAQDADPEEIGDEELDEAHEDEEHDEEEEELPEEDELERVVSAETQEWDVLEAAEAEAEADEPTLVTSAGRRVKQAGSAITSSFERVRGEKITSGFKGVRRRLRFPLWARFLTAAFVIIGSVGTATAASLILYIGDIAERLELDKGFEGIQDRLASVDGGAPQTILILGSDKRPEFKGGKFRGLSDTTMLLRVDPDRNAIALFSLPRDLKVEIPGYGVAKLNEAYFAGGPELTLRTIQQLTDVPSLPGGLEVNHLVNVDFEGFARAVNEIDCVYVDVDRRYFHSNDNTAAAEDYEEIDLQPGYQALCGFDALDYARYRHTDNDVVRAARQQDFLREARAKVPPEVVFAQRKNLIDIFTEHTTSDIDKAGEMLEVLKLFIEARDAPVREIHFKGQIGPSFVTTTPDEIDRAVRQFLGIEDTPGARGRTAAPDEPVSPEQAPDEAAATPEAPAAQAKGQKGKGGGRGREPAELTPTSYGKVLARGIRARSVKLPIYYPTVLETGSDFEQKPRAYKINGTGRGAPPTGERAAYKWVFSRPVLGEYYGFMATRWKDPPILDSPSETREIGDREYELFYDGDRLRLVAWQTGEGSFWLSNTLIQSLSDREMIEIAEGMRALPRRGR
jgi:polyisoprenyl-teichoic acid--peptidoglycan teichoic acid transferase